MKDTEWLDGIHEMDTLPPPIEEQGVLVYTLFLRDFLTMPDVNFKEAMKTDDHLRSLLN